MPSIDQATDALKIVPDIASDRVVDARQSSRPEHRETDHEKDANTETLHSSSAETMHALSCCYCKYVYYVVAGAAVMRLHGNAVECQ